MTARDTDLQEQLRRFHLLDQVMPVMLAYVDSTQHYRYHNRAFRDWHGHHGAQINGRTMLDVLGHEAYSQIEARVARALSGQSIHYERTHRGPEASVQRLSVHLVPHHEAGGGVAGLFVLVADQGHRGKAALPAQARASVNEAPTLADAQTLYEQSIDMDLTGWRNAADRIKSALRNDEFLLYAQLIRDLNDDSHRFYEIYLRMTEEEENMMPPGAFFPLAEKYGLMRELDRWTVTQVLMAAAARGDGTQSAAAFCVTLSRDSIADPGFCDFVRGELARHGIPGETLRFQLSVRDVEENPGDAAHLVQQLIHIDCPSVLQGFGRDRVDFELLKDLPIVFLRIDSGIIYRVQRDESALATLKSINRVAHTVGINTIADLVESEEMIATLREVGVDYAHGVGIGIPVPLGEVL